MGGEVTSEHAEKRARRKKKALYKALIALTDTSLSFASDPDDSSGLIEPLVSIQVNPTTLLETLTFNRETTQSIVGTTKQPLF